MTIKKSRAYILSTIYLKEAKIVENRWLEFQ